MNSNNSWLQHTLRRAGWQPQRQVIAVSILGLFIALIIGALYLSQVATEASRGREMRDLIVERDELERQNEQLRLDIAELKSLQRLRTAANEMGFVLASSDDVRYLLVEGYTADRNQIVEQIEPIPTQAPEYTETFSGWLDQQWRTLSGQFETFTQQVE